MSESEKNDQARQSAGASSSSTPASPARPSARPAVLAACSPPAAAERPPPRPRRYHDHHRDRGAGTTTTAAAAETTTTVAAGVEMGREIKIGAVSPVTGGLASFGGPDKWIVTYVMKAVGDGVVCGDGKKHPVKIIQLDSQSSPNRAGRGRGGPHLQREGRHDGGLVEPGHGQPGRRPVRSQRHPVPGELRAVAAVLSSALAGRHRGETVQVDLHVPLRRRRRRGVPSRHVEPGADQQAGRASLPERRRRPGLGQREDRASAAS